MAKKFRDGTLGVCREFLFWFYPKGSKMRKRIQLGLMALLVGLGLWKTVDLSLPLVGSAWAYATSKSTTVKRFEALEQWVDRLEAAKTEKVP